MKPFNAAMGLLAVAACLVGTAARAAEVEHLNDATVMPEGLPFSEAVRVDDTIYLSGQIGVKPGTLTLVEGGMPAEARQTLDNIRATLEAHGHAMDDIVKCTVMLADMSEWGAFNEIYQTYFEAPYPARSAFGATGLALGGRLEVECIAVVREPEPAQPIREEMVDEEDRVERVYKRPGAQ
jgi:reactive intermediate/imine deaminase